MRPLLLPLLLVVLAMISIQSGASLAKQLFPILGPVGTTTLRVGCAALMLLAFYRPWKQSWPRKGWPLLMAYGATLGLMNLLFYLSLARIPLGLAVALEFTGPLGLAVLRSRRGRDWIWAVFAIFGVILILPLGQIEGHLDPLGVALALAAGLCWALYIVFGQRVSLLGGAGPVTSLGMLFAALVVLPFGIWDQGSALFATDHLVWVLGIALLSSAIPYSLEMNALSKMPAQSFSILMSLEPAIASLSGLLFLGERLDGRQILAIALVITASLGTALSPPPSPPPEPNPV